MKKRNYKLTANQIQRGVIFSSVLVQNKQTDDDIVKEVISVSHQMKSMNLAKLSKYEIAKLEQDLHQNNDITISRLLDDKFFNPSYFTHNIIRR